MRKLWPLLLLVAGCDRPPADGNGTNAHADTSAPPAPVKAAWSALSEYEYSQRMKFPDGVTALHGKRIEIAGFIYRTRELRDLKEFILMRDPGTCCYGPQIKWNHFLMVRVVKGRGVNYTPDPITVVGTFRLNEKIDGDYVDGLYELEAEEHRRP